MKIRLLVIMSLLLSASSLLAEPRQQTPFAANEKLGTVHFPISCAASQQQAFERGVALLHDFWYDKAALQFQQIETADPTCAIAYWGQAMALFHQIWDRPGEATLQRGNELVQKGLKLEPKTPRERDYLDALAVFYQNPSAGNFEARVTAYSNAMEALYHKYPQDHEAGAFYALSLLAAAPPRDPTFANQKKALAVLNQLSVVAPDNPGVAHYTIHSCDSPQMAAEGLAAAKRYADIAPSAPHAAHMPSHIFARLGLWPEDIQSNLASIAAAEKSGSLGHELHAMDFLLYAYLQVGEDDKAHQLIVKLNAMDVGMSGHDMQGYLDRARAQFPATYTVELRHWPEASALQPAKNAKPQNAATTYWARAVGNGHLHNLAAAKQDLAHYDAMVEAVKKSPDAYLAEFMDTDRDEIRAWIAFADGQPTEAAEIMRSVADKQDAHGKQEVEIPAREMLADILLESNHPEQALAEYERSMQIDSNRFNGLYGAARAAELSKQPAKADKYYAQLVNNCAGAQSNRPELARAKAQLAGKTAEGGN